MGVVIVITHIKLMIFIIGTITIAKGTGISFMTGILIQTAIPIVITTFFTTTSQAKLMILIGDIGKYTGVVTTINRIYIISIFSTKFNLISFCLFSTTRALCDISS